MLASTPLRPEMVPGRRGLLGQHDRIAPGVVAGAGADEVVVTPGHVLVCACDSTAVPHASGVGPVAELLVPEPFRLYDAVEVADGKLTVSKGEGVKFVEPLTSGLMKPARRLRVETA